MERGEDVGVLAHLQTFGELSEDGVALVYRLVGDCLRKQGMPPPIGKAAWSEESVMEAAHDFVSEHLLGRQRLGWLMLRAADESGLEALLRTMILNFFRDRARATDKGALMRRLGSLLLEDDSFRLWQEGSSRFGKDSFWGRSGWDHPAPFTGNPAILISAAWAIDGIRIVRWRESSTRRSPVADRESLVAFLAGIFEAAGGTLTVPGIAAIAVSRFSLLASPTFIALDDPDKRLELEERVATPEEQVGARAVAVIVLDQLSEREREIFLRMGSAPLREVAEEMGLPKSTVFDSASRVRSMVTTASGEEETAVVLQELERMLGDATS